MPRYSPNMPISSIRLGSSKAFPSQWAQGLIYRGWAKAVTGGFDDEITLLRAGVAAYQAIGARWWMPQFYPLQADVDVIGGYPDVALGILIEALATSRERGGNWFEAELVFSPRRQSGIKSVLGSGRG